jgi:hypothetical protein
MLKTEQLARSWDLSMRSDEVRKRLDPVNAPEELIRAIESGIATRHRERKTRLLEIEQSL